MDLTEGSETSANIKQTLGKHPKVNTVNTEHSESLKSRITLHVQTYRYRRASPFMHITAHIRAFLTEEL
jgi:hypothetical protein